MVKWGYKLFHILHITRPLFICFKDLIDLVNRIGGQEGQENVTAFGFQKIVDIAQGSLEILYPMEAIERGDMVESATQFLGELFASYVQNLESGSLLPLIMLAGIAHHLAGDIGAHQLTPDGEQGPHEVH